ncbi:MAG TPA: 30S ribosomal protein S17 [bacterium]|jgi:small subunit ribosomal protein S17|nr:30S ribosomal protein S17 [bacterium]HOG38081.1 30S ribosomal protein S17 [bacterium]HQI03137.1 30S ribosomal protein S17 [bacterium]
MTQEIKKEARKKQFRELKGVVISNKMNKTVTVKVDTSRQHKIYKKRYVVSNKYKAHDEYNQYKVGDYVAIRQVKPISKDKKWQVIRKIK